MYLLYIDESGNENDPNDRYFVLAGIALFERQTYFLTEAIERIQETHFPRSQPVHFHASEIRSGRQGFWRKVPSNKRDTILSEVGSAIQRSPDSGRILYAAVVEKDNELWGERAVEVATEQLCNRFDIFLQRKFHEEQDPQRGLIVFSEGRFNARAKIWVTGFHQRGTQWGAITNLADIPYFASTRESRLLQVADFVAHGIWLLYERRDATLIGPLIPYFDNNRGILHGLVHVRQERLVPCDCPACACRRRAGDFGTWL